MSEGLPVVNDQIGLFRDVSHVFREREPDEPFTPRTTGIGTASAATGLVGFSRGRSGRPPTPSKTGGRERLRTGEIRIGGRGGAGVGDFACLSRAGDRDRGRRRFLSTCRLSTSLRGRSGGLVLRLCIARRWKTICRNASRSRVEAGNALYSFNARSTLFRSLKTMKEYSFCSFSDVQKYMA